MTPAFVDDPLYIVFYGTLKAGSLQFEKLGLGQHLNYVCDCEIKGDLYDIKDPTENYPALVEGKGTVKGQLFEIRDHGFLEQADIYEGILKDDPANSLYLRRALHLQKPDVDAWVYVYNKPVGDAPKINSGDWSLYLSEKDIKKGPAPGPSSLPGFTPQP